MGSNPASPTTSSPAPGRPDAPPLDSLGWAPAPTGAAFEEDALAMAAATPTFREHGNAYNIFMLVLTIFSLALMVLTLLPLNEGTRELVTVYDNAICVIFLSTSR